MTLLKRPSQEIRTIGRFKILTEIFNASGRSRISPRRGRQLPGGGHQHMILPYFSENYMKLKEFGPRGRGARVPHAPLDPPLNAYMFKTSNNTCVHFQDTRESNQKSTNQLATLLKPISEMTVP